MSIIADSPEAIALLKSVGIPALIHQSDSLLKGDVDFDFGTVLPLLHTAANQYRGEGQHAEAKPVFERILRHVLYLSSVSWSALEKADSFRAAWGSGETVTRH